MLKMVLKLKVKGLLVGGPPCGSWIWVNRATSQRTRQRIFGNTSRGYVKDANTNLCLIRAAIKVGQILLIIIILYYRAGCFPGM